MQIITCVTLTETRDIPLANNRAEEYTVGDMVNDEIANMLYRKGRPMEEPGMNKVHGIQSIKIIFDEADSEKLIKQINL